VNFKKFEKTALPNYDHLMNSSVFKMIHKMEVEPKKGIPVRPSKVIAAEDIIERVVSASGKRMKKDGVDVGSRLEGKDKWSHLLILFMLSFQNTPVCCMANNNSLTSVSH
jgi:hypothetical protein